MHSPATTRTVFLGSALTLSYSFKAWHLSTCHVVSTLPQTSCGYDGLLMSTKISIVAFKSAVVIEGCRSFTNILNSNDFVILFLSLKGIPNCGNKLSTLSVHWSAAALNSNNITVYPIYMIMDFSDRFLF